MYIKKLRVENYKCFLDTGDIELTPGFNIIVGRNDAGKSALLEAVGLIAQARPHASLETRPSADTPVNGNSTITIDYGFSEGELRTFFSRFSEFSQRELVRQSAQPLDDAAAFNEAFGRAKDFTARWINQSLNNAWLDSMEQRVGERYNLFENVLHPNGVQVNVKGRFTGGAPGNEYGFLFADHLKQATYTFKAERMNVGECPVGGSNQLAPDARNLPDVLNQLSSSNPVRFERLMGHIRTVFPHVTQVASSVVNSSSVRVMVWSIPRETERADLAVPLAESGTGIGQVLAMLYVVVTSDTPKVIVIDEPQSFLHPGAVRKLLEILRAYPQHQYVITSHSPVALTFSENDRVFLVRRDGGASTVTIIDPTSEDDLRTSLAEVGARLSDVFGADTILWVEGKTEELCFPEIIKGLAEVPLKGAQILGVISTDEIVGPKATTRILEIYDRLTRGASLLPPALAFVFDKEGRTAIERADIDRRSGGKVKWLPLRLYENYLLSPSAIEKVLNGEDVDRASPITAEDIDAWLKENGGDAKYFGKSGTQNYGESQWQEYVHGAVLLRDLFDELSHARVSYDKVKHGLLLTKYLIKSPAAEFRALAEFLSGLIA